jgi:soluble lytic murein transglycosylase-like protein
LSKNIIYFLKQKNRENKRREFVKKGLKSKYFMSQNIIKSRNFKLLTIATILLLSIIAFPKSSEAKVKKINAYAQKDELPSSAPRVLYDKDIKLYRKAFALQKNGKIEEADKLLKKVDNKVLMGYFLYHRYMSPYYKTKYAEAKNWLNKYSDLPIANKVYELAKMKAGKGADTSELKVNKKPKRSNFYISADAIGHDRIIKSSYRHLSRTKRAKAKKVIKDYEWAMRNGYTKNAKRTLQSAEAKKYITKGDYHRMSSNLAHKYFIDYKYDDAIEWAKKPAEKYNDAKGNWTMGLALFHNKKYDEAKKYFVRLAKNKDTSLSQISAGAYWAYKSLEKKKITIDDDIAKIEKEKMDYLKFASNYPKTFYGVIARYQLGMTLNDDWSTEEFSFTNAKEILSWRAGVRSIALMQMGFKQEAMAELRWLIFNNKQKSDELIRSVMIFAEVCGMQNLALGIAPYFKDEKGELLYTSYLYPEITLEDDSAWKIDKALVHSFIRQESMFKSRASSYVGAIGLMQLMPSTASWLEKDRNLRSKEGRRKLENPSYNIYLGQKYVGYLLNTPQVNQDLIKLIISYNAGPGNMDRWTKRYFRESEMEDPLFFIESIRARETRIHVQRVLTNLWHYREKYGQRIPSIEDLINGQWAKYKNMDLHLKQNFPKQ